MYWEIVAENAKKAWQARYPKGIVCRSHKFIYFPVPKVATSSMKRLIAGLCGLRSDGNPHCVVFETVDARRINTFDGFARFAIVRNPWARLYSCYKHKIESRREQLFPGFRRYNRILGYPLFNPEMSFEAFVTVVRRIPDTLSDEHFRSQHRLLCYPKNSLLPERIAKFENFDELGEILTSLNIREAKLDHLNATATLGYRDHYTRKMREIVSRRYRQDIEMFKYEFC